MFCRYCGSYIADDSVFCAKCGKRLGKRENTQLTKIVQKLRLKTPYPYFALLLIGFVGWAMGPRQSHANFGLLKWKFELDRKLNVTNENLFQQSLSLVVENSGSTPVLDVPIELSAKIEPQKPAEVVAGFLGRKLLIMQRGRPNPLVILLDKVDPGAKRRYFIEGAITAEPPFKLTYEVREEDKKPVLATYVVEE
jgi:hypothetical protein